MMQSLTTSAIRMMLMPMIDLDGPRMERVWSATFIEDHALSTGMTMSSADGSSKLFTSLPCLRTSSTKLQTTERFR
jgi:hypothetical protein